MPLVAVYTASKSAIEGFSESLALELATVGIRVKLVEPGYGPETDFTANSHDRMNGLISKPYQAFADRLFSAAGAPDETTSADDVAQAVFCAATDRTDRLRFAAGADAVRLADARRRTQDEQFLSGMRAMFGVSAPA